MPDLPDSGPTTIRLYEPDRLAVAAIQEHLRRQDLTGRAVSLSQAIRWALRVQAQALAGPPPKG